MSAASTSSPSPIKSPTLDSATPLSQKLGHGHVKPDGTRKPWTYLRGRRYACLKLNDDRDIIKVTGRQLKKSQRNRLWRAKAYYREAEDKAKRVIRNMH